MTSIMVSKIHSNSHRITKKDLHNFSLRISSESVTPVTSTPYSVAMRSARAPKPQPNSKTFIPGNDGQVAYGDGCGLKIMGKPTETQKSGKKNGRISKNAGGDKHGLSIFHRKMAMLVDLLMFQ